MAVGEGENDIGMLQFVRCGVAMGNGNQQIKAVADYVAPSVDDDGIMKALQDLGVI